MKTSTLDSCGRGAAHSSFRLASEGKCSHPLLALRATGHAIDDVAFPVLRLENQLHRCVCWDVFVGNSEIVEETVDISEPVLVKISVDLNLHVVLLVRQYLDGSVHLVQHERNRS